MRMVDRQHIPAFLVDLLQRVQLLLWVAEVAYLRLVVHVFERVNLERLAVFAANNAAGFLGCICARQCNQLLELIMCQLHSCPP